MASVDHPCCVRIQAVCMTAHMMLISELLPTGSLLDYVRDHQCKLRSATLLCWAKQIAEVRIIARAANGFNYTAANVLMIMYSVTR